MSHMHSKELRAAAVPHIRAAANGPTPATEPEAMHAWLGSGSETLLTAMEYYGAEGPDFGGAFELFAASSDADRRAMLRALADALADALAAQGAAS